MAGIQEQVDAILRQMEVHRGDIDSLLHRADVTEMRADAADHRADATELRADEADDRARRAEARADVDRDMIAELQRDGVLTQQHAAQMEEALKSSRTVGAAIGILMASRSVSESEAFAILRSTSQDSNRKVRDLAAELVASAEVEAPAHVNRSGPAGPGR